MEAVLVRISSGNQLGETVYWVEIRENGTETKSEERSYRVLPGTGGPWPTGKGRLGEPELERLEKADGVCKAVLHGLSILSFGSNTRIGLIRKLRQRGHSADAAECAVGFLVKQGYIRECEDIERKIELYAQSGKSRAEIVGKLRQDGYGEDALAAARGAIQSIDFGRVCAAAWKKRCHRGIPEDDELRKSVQALLRRGFTKDEVVRGLKYYGEEIVGES
ncbi:MAG: RecX family transcriptional regulator [Clostridia bacterium]|nr:RecX family transcriptional regulator [Clostridia bacterium]